MGCKDKRFNYSPYFPERVEPIQTLTQFETRVTFNGVKAVGARIWHSPHVMSMLRMRGAISPTPTPQMNHEAITRSCSSNKMHTQSTSQLLTIKRVFIGSLRQQSPSWEANSSSANQKSTRYLWNPQVHYTIHNSPSPVSILSQTNPVHALLSHFMKPHSNIILQFMSRYSKWRVRDSSVGIATRYGLDGPEIESRWSEIFRTRPDEPCGPPSLL
jgi:hypothetical protein